MSNFYHSKIEIISTNSEWKTTFEAASNMARKSLQKYINRVGL